jgi:hypothetical protein
MTSEGEDKRKQRKEKTTVRLLTALKRSYKAEKRMDGKRQKGKMSKIRI